MDFTLCVREQLTLSTHYPWPPRRYLYTKR